VRYPSKTISLLLLCLAQLFVPIFNFAIDLPCSETQAQACQSAPCCRTEASPRMVCCDTPVRATDHSALATLEKPSRLPADFNAPIEFAEVGGDLDLQLRADDDFSAFNSFLFGNQRYKLLSTFLI
jgi:hypothetical protein